MSAFLSLRTGIRIYWIFVPVIDMEYRWHYRELPAILTCHGLCKEFGLIQNGMIDDPVALQKEKEKDQPGRDGG